MNSSISENKKQKLSKLKEKYKIHESLIIKNGFGMKKKKLKV